MFFSPAFFLFIFIRFSWKIIFVDVGIWAKMFSFAVRGFCQKDVKMECSQCIWKRMGKRTVQFKKQMTLDFFLQFFSKNFQFILSCHSTNHCGLKHTHAAALTKKSNRRKSRFPHPNKFSRTNENFSRSQTFFSQSQCDMTYLEWLCQVDITFRKIIIKMIKEKQRNFE